METDTIFALSTPRGRAAIAVIRVSGPLADQTLARLTGAALPAPRLASVRTLRNGPDGDAIDEALIIRYQDGQSYTCENSFEIQCHGGIAVVKALLDALADSPGLRLAEPGEFTRRALEFGRMDLSQVEGLADLIDAETQAQRRQALRVMRGDLTRRVDTWRRLLTRARALTEASIDFADEEIPDNLNIEVDQLLAEAHSSLLNTLKGANAAERIRDGFEVAIIGAPNAGKSTLLNRLAGRDVAIASDIPGTTRDVLEVHMELEGLPVTLLDTAGLRETQDTVESLGVERARSRAAAADLRVLLVGPDECISDKSLLQSGDLEVSSKADLQAGPCELHLSAHTGQGIDVLTKRIADILSKRASGASSVIRLRQRVAVERASELIGEARSILANGRREDEMVAESIRLANAELACVVGRVDIEQVLDEVFSSFCLGK